jgi:hypothetical protein
MVGLRPWLGKPKGTVTCAFKFECTVKCRGYPQLLSATLSYPQLPSATLSMVSLTQQQGDASEDLHTAAYKVRCVAHPANHAWGHAGGIPCA